MVAGLSLLLHGQGIPVVLGPLWPLWEPTEVSHASRVSAVGAWVRDRLLGVQFRRADGVLAPTPASAARVSEALQSRTEVFSFPIGIDLPSAALEPSPDTPTVLFLANLQERKGIFVLLEAFERLARRMPSARLVVAGGGWNEAEVRCRAAASPARERIELLGAIRREELAATLARGTVYCLPSFGEPYGMSAGGHGR